MGAQALGWQLTKQSAFLRNLLTLRSWVQTTELQPAGLNTCIPGSQAVFLPNGQLSSHLLAQTPHTSTALKWGLSLLPDWDKNEVRVLEASFPLCVPHSWRAQSSGRLLRTAMTQHSSKATAVYAFLFCCVSTNQHSTHWRQKGTLLNYLNDWLKQTQRLVPNKTYLVLNYTAKTAFNDLRLLLRVFTSSCVVTALAQG